MLFRSDDIDMKKIEDEMSKISFVNKKQNTQNQEQSIDKILKNAPKEPQKEVKIKKKSKKKANKSTIIEGQMSLFDL